MAKEKYTVFISSTFEDLRDERDQIIKAILEMGHIPVGMEMFSAGDEQQWELIKRTIEECDYYIVVTAYRYGSLDASISFTEKEYDYAASIGVPILGFVIDDDAKWSKNKMDTDPIKIDLLNKFKVKIKSKIVSIWKSKDELNAKVTVSLSKAITAYPRQGWIKAEGSIAAESIKELTRLSKENADLRKRISDFIQSKSDNDKSAETKIISMLNSNHIMISFYYDGDTEWSNNINKSYMDMFYLLAPELMIETSVLVSASFIGTMWNPDNSSPNKTLRRRWPIPSNVLKNIFADFQALELIVPSPKRHAVSDKEEYWSITEKGIKAYNQIRISKLESALVKVDN